MENVMVSWSGGKDSAIALYEILKNYNYQISALLTTVTEGYDRNQHARCSADSARAASCLIGLSA